MPVYALEGIRPVIDPSVYLAPTAALIGNVTIGGQSSVWFNSVVRADSEAIVIGRETNVQDFTMCHVDAGFPLTIGDRVTVGHRCVIHGCSVADDCLIGMGAIIMNGVRIGRGCIVAAGTVILEHTEIPPFSLVAGVPGKVKRTLEADIISVINVSVQIYKERSQAYQRPGNFQAVA
ncbi:MAG: gamma carbonic anhydrase family protein [Desulfobacterales bacterium]|jgi:carbonic anhydrase/acetyltransferase-like protein (isoleucine patch superfamily)|nr:gamma carbonic anhydrase family protein [Desulfobacterales bacterium]